MVNKNIKNIITEIVRKTVVESLNKCPFYDYLEEYSPYNIFQMYESDDELFTPLINPIMYKHALSEFIKNGHFFHFPTKYIYQWMGIIMRNTAIIHSITVIAGHYEYSAIDDFIEFYFGNEDDPHEAFEKYKSQINDDDYGAMTEYLDNIGFYNWTLLPDGSDAWSDYGMQPLMDICLKYNDNLSPEEVLILINKALDITHQRGDLASAFIIGGSKTLSEISN